MATRTWLAVALSCLVWFGYLKWFAPPPPVRSVDPKTLVNSGVPAQTPENGTAQGVASIITAPTQAGELIRLESQHLTVELGSSSAEIFRASLNDYKEGLSNDSARVQVVSPTVNPGSLSFQFTDPEARKALEGPFEISQTASGVTFSRRTNGFQIRRDYSLVGDYMVDVKNTFVLPAKSRGDWGHLLIPVGGRGLQSDHNNPMLTWEVVFQQNQKTERLALEKIENQIVRQGMTNWVSFGNRYFVGAVLNRSALNPDVVTSSVDGFSGISLRYPLSKPGTAEYEIKTSFYLGPKDLKFLSQEPALSELVEHGMFSFFAKPILYLLNFFYGFVHNYGVAIILLTILVRALFYPLSLKSYRSMRSMQKLQPQLLVLKERYKDDRERFNREQVALFKTHSVNPAGGCLPMLVQLPVFIALYAVLQNSIELFHAPFFWWIRDLSAKDPLYVYPVLMGIAMFLQQKMTPTPGMDPMQQKMMLIMPVVFTFMMVNLPAGLTLYIFLSTLLGILQQWAMNREKHKEARVSAATT